MALFSLGVGGEEARFVGLENLNELERDRCVLAILGGEGAVATLVPVWGPILQGNVKATYGIASKPVGDNVPPGIAFVTPGAV